MRKSRYALFLGGISLLVVLSLLIGCRPTRPIAPDVTATPVGGAQVAPTEEGMPNPTDMAATAQAESVRATQQAAGAEGADAGGAVTEEPTATPTLEPPTETPTATVAVTPTTAVPTTAAPTVLPTATPVPGGDTHVVRRGENLYRIALRYGTTVQDIASLNGIANPSLIYVGQVLTIPSGAQPSPGPGGTTYVVRRGDNLFRIALRYSLSYVYLAQYNGIANPSRIYVGQVLRIPPR